MGEIQNNDLEIKTEEVKKKKDYLLPGSIVIAGLLISGSWMYDSTLQYLKPSGEVQDQKAIQKLQESVVPTSGAVIPVRWGDLGIQLVETGVIDKTAWDKLNKSRGGVPEEVNKFFSDMGSQQ